MMKICWRNAPWELNCSFISKSCLRRKRRGMKQLATGTLILFEILPSVVFQQMDLEYKIFRWRKLGSNLSVVFKWKKPLEHIRLAAQLSGQKRISKPSSAFLPQLIESNNFHKMSQRSFVDSMSRFNQIRERRIFCDERCMFVERRQCESSIELDR